MLYDNLLVKVDGFKTVENSKEIFKEGIETNMFLLDLERDIWTKVPKECLLDQNVEVEVMINRQLQINQIHDTALNLFDNKYDEVDSDIEEAMNEVDSLLEELMS